jgi:hypothetical protein
MPRRTAPVPTDPFDALRLSPAHVERWLKKNGVSVSAIERGAPCWPGADGMMPLSVADIERLISFEDPVAWAYLNLTEKKDIVIDGVVAVKAGDPWRLFPIQAELARTEGDLIIESGSEVGKTRDIVLRILRGCDAAKGPGDLLVGGDNETTLEKIWEEIEFQLEKNPLIAGGLKERPHLKPRRSMKFRNETSFEMRPCGDDGTQFRNAHASLEILADEVAKWKNPKIFDEFWRAALPGAVARIYSAPDGDYSSPFFKLCDRATPVGGPKAAAARPKETSEADLTGGRKFRKFHISKKQLPAPFWSEARADFYRKTFGGEQSSGWITNVEGKWGSPSYSVFPMDQLRPCLSLVPEFRIVVAHVDREAGEVSLSAARLSESDQDGEREVILADERLPAADTVGLARAIAAFFPPEAQEGGSWITPRIYCGGDLGSAQDPTELVFDRVVGEKWIDAFRLHLSGADWPLQAAIVAHLDHASAHRAKYSLDNGSAGSALVQVLTQVEQFAKCPVCSKVVLFAERMVGRNFADKVDEIDPYTGEPKVNTDKRDAAGEPLPNRLSNKEFGTRILERKMQARGELVIAHDAGAGDQKLASSQLLVNHTAEGMTQLGERRFKARDDHHPDARRQLALAIVGEFRGNEIDMATAQFASASPRASVGVSAAHAYGPVALGLGEFAGGSVRGGFFE